MSAHTPGPWQIKSEQEPLVVIGNIDGPDDGRFHYTTICDLDYDPAPHAGANARLIAAAPDMLEALRDLLECVDGDGSDKSPTEHKAARAAIAKATVA